MNENILEWEDWEDLVLKIRTWDRNEHNWARAFASENVEIKNLKTKDSFIKSLMDQYELKKKDNIIH